MGSPVSVAAYKPIEYKPINDTYHLEQFPVKSGWRQLEWLSSSGKGVYYANKTANKGLNWGIKVAEMSGASQPSLQGWKRAATVFGNVANGTAVVTLAFSATPAVVDSVTDLVEGPTTVDKILAVINSAFDWISYACYAALLFIGCEGLLRTAAISDLVADGSSAVIEGRKLYRFTNLKNGLGSGIQATPAQQAQIDSVREDLTREQTNIILKLSKEITAIAAGILGILAWVFTGMIIPAIVLLTVSLASTIFALAAHFHRQNMPWHLHGSPDHPQPKPKGTLDAQAIAQLPPAPQVPPVVV